MKWLAALALLPMLASEPAGDATAANPSAPPLETWRFNARERTARGLAAWKNEKPDAAVPAFDSALRLRPDDPLATYNAGTARLGAGEPGAEALLARAAQGLPADLAPDAYYNLGNARLAGQNAKGAIDAYREALRRRPDFNEAKRNLELAWKLLEQQQQQQQEQKQQDQKQDQKQQKQEQQSGQGQENEQQHSSDDSSKPGNEPPSQEEQNRPSPPREDGEERSQSGDPQQDRGESSPSNAQQRPLPQFHDQQDMTAEQAAAILQAVENLERQQRREQAAERARGKARVEKDW